MKKWGKISATMLSVILCGALILTPALAYYGEGPSGWARQEVRAAIDSGFPNWETEDSGWSLSWTEENGDNSYCAPISRIQFCHLIGTILAKDKNLATYQQERQAEQVGYRPSFSDLKRTMWNYEVYLANYHGIIDGVSKDEFDPYGILTREQAAKILAKTIIVLRPSLWQEEKDYMADKTISDQDKVSSWAANYIGFVIDNDLMCGKGDGTFAPQEPFTTQQAIVTCYRLCQQLQVPRIIPTEQARLWLDSYRMNREVAFFAGDISVYYGGFADGIDRISVGNITVDDIGELGAPMHSYGSEEGYPLEAYKAELHVGARNMKKDTYYTAHIELMLTMEDGGKQEITDTFVFMY